MLSLPSKNKKGVRWGVKAKNEYSQRHHHAGFLCTMSQRSKSGKNTKKKRRKTVVLISLLFVIVVIVGFFSFVPTGFKGVRPPSGAMETTSLNS